MIELDSLSPFDSRARPFSFSFCHSLRYVYPGIVVWKPRSGYGVFSILEEKKGLGQAVCVVEAHSGRKENLLTDVTEFEDRDNIDIVL